MTSRNVPVREMRAMVQTTTMVGQTPATVRQDRGLQPAGCSKIPDLIDQKVGLNVRTRRIQLGMSQDTLGERLGVSLQQVQKYEKGTNRIGSSRMVRIATALQAPVSFFYEGVEQAIATPIDPVTALSSAGPDERIILDQLLALHQAGDREAIRHIRQTLDLLSKRIPDRE
jgi:transcriptional regulator with XRE-family HTH domain